MQEDGRYGAATRDGARAFRHDVRGRRLPRLPAGRFCRGCACRRRRHVQVPRDAAPQPVGAEATSRAEGSSSRLLHAGDGRVGGVRPETHPGRRHPVPLRRVVQALRNLHQPRDRRVEDNRFSHDASPTGRATPCTSTTRKPEPQASQVPLTSGCLTWRRVAGYQAVAAGVPRRHPTGHRYCEDVWQRQAPFDPTSRGTKQAVCSEMIEKAYLGRGRVVGAGADPVHAALQALAAARSGGLRLLEAPGLRAGVRPRQPILRTFARRCWKRLRTESGQAPGSAEAADLRRHAACAEKPAERLPPGRRLPLDKRRFFIPKLGAGSPDEASCAGRWEDRRVASGSVGSS